MTVTAETTPPDAALERLPDSYWSERAWQAAREHPLSTWVKPVPSDNAPLEVRMDALSGALDVARMSLAHMGSSRPGEVAAAFIDAVAAVYDARPEPLPAVLDRSTPPTVLAMVKIASTIAHDPEIVETLPDALVEAMDMLLGRTNESKAKPLARYRDDRAARLERLADELESRLKWTAAKHRRRAGAPTRAEARQLAELREQGIDL